MKKKIRKTLLSLISSIILLVSVTYAWIIGLDPIKTKMVSLEMSDNSALYVIAVSLDVRMYFFDKNTREYVEAQDALVLNNIIPNEMIPFKILFKNTSGVEQSVSLSLAEIKTDNPRILNYMYVEASGGDGYVLGDSITPDNVFLCFSDANFYESTNDYQLTLYRTLIVPATGNDTVEIKGFFWFHSEADISVSDSSFEINKLRIVLS